MTPDLDSDLADALALVNRDYNRQQTFPAGILHRLLDFVMWPDRLGAKPVAHDIWIRHCNPGGPFLCASTSDRAVLVRPTAAIDDLSLGALHVQELRTLLGGMGAARPYVLRERDEYVVRDLGGDRLHLPSKPADNEGAARPAFDAYQRADYAQEWIMPFEIGEIRRLKAELIRAFRSVGAATLTAAFHRWGEAIISPDGSATITCNMGFKGAGPWCPDDASVHLRLPVHAFLSLFENLFDACPRNYGVLLKIVLAPGATVLFLEREFDVADDGGTWRKKAPNYPFRVTNIALGQAPLDGPIVRHDPRPPLPPATPEQERFNYALATDDDSTP